MAALQCVAEQYRRIGADALKKIAAYDPCRSCRRLRSFDLWTAYAGLTLPNAPCRETTISTPNAPAAINHGNACPLTH